MSTYLITGGTGKVGRRLGNLLAQAGHVVRVASRTGGDVRFDWLDSSSYPQALEGIDGMFLVGPGSATDWSQTLATFLARADEAGVAHAVFLSARGVEFHTDGAVARAEQALWGGPIPWTILRPSHFTQNFTEAMFVPEGDTVTAPVGDGAEPFIDVEDIAHVAAEVLTGTGWRNEIIEISGPEALTFDRAVSLISPYAGRTLRFVDEDLDSHAEGLRAKKTPEGYVAWRLAMLGAIRRGDDAHLSDGVQRVLGRPATPFADWAAREAFTLAASAR